MLLTRTKTFSAARTPRVAKSTAHQMCLNLFAYCQSSRPIYQKARYQKVRCQKAGLLMLLFACAHTHAQTPTNTQVNLANVINFPVQVVTATRTDRDLYDVPIPVAVISSKTLQANQARTLKEALELLPNVILRPVHGKTGYEVIMQGLSAEQVLVLIDGMPITASTGSAVNLNQYLNVQVEQIEVVQGASSAQYGSAAMGGVINVITKKLAQDGKKSRFKGNLSAEIGSNGKQNPSGKNPDVNRTYLDGSLDARLDDTGNLQARLSASYLDEKGLQQEEQTWAYLKDKSEQAQLSARLQYQVDAGNTDKQLWLAGSYYHEDDTSRFNRRVAQNILKRQKEEAISKQNVSTGFNYRLTGGRLADTRLQGQLFYEHYDSGSDTFSITTKGKQISIDRDAEIDTKLAKLQMDLPDIDFGDTHSHAIQLGGKWQADNLSQTNNGKNELVSDEAKRNVSELYLQDDWFIGNNFEVLTGLRYQNDSDFGSHTAPKIAVKYGYGKDDNHEHVWRASIGKGYRVPNLKERYYVFDHSVYGYMVMGNPQLQPETSTSYQLGYQGKLTDQLNITANAFYNEVQDLIQTDSNNPLVKDGISIYRYQNVNNASTYGGDIGIDWRMSSQHSLKANYSHTRTKNKTTDTELVARPRHKASLYLTSKLYNQGASQFDLINHIRYESKHLVSSAQLAYSPAWWTWDIKGNYQLSSQFSLHAGIKNILNKQRDTSNPNDQGPIDNRQVILGGRFVF